MLTFNNVYNKLSSSHTSTYFQHSICFAYVTKSTTQCLCCCYLIINQQQHCQELLLKCISMYQQAVFTSSGIFVDACCDSPHEQDHNFLKPSQLYYHMLNEMSHQCDVFSYRASQCDYSSSGFGQNPENLSFMFNSLSSQHAFIRTSAITRGHREDRSRHILVFANELNASLHTCIKN